MLLQAWVPALPFLNGINGPSWSLSCEAFFYALMPAVHRSLTRRSSRSLALICLVALAIAALVAAFLRILVGGDLVALCLHMNPIYRLCEFIVGIALALLLRRGRLPRVQMPLAASAVLAAFGCLSVLNIAITRDVGVFANLPFNSLPTDIASVLISPLCGLLIVAAAQADLDERPSHLRSRVMTQLGTWSFSLYMTHMLVIMAVRPLLPANLPTVASVSLALALISGSVAVSWVAYRVVEHPLERLLRAPRPRYQNPRGGISTETTNMPNL